MAIIKSKGHSVEIKSYKAIGETHSCHKFKDIREMVGFIDDLIKGFGLNRDLCNKKRKVRVNVWWAIREVVVIDSSKLINS